VKGVVGSREQLLEQLRAEIVSIGREYAMRLLNACERPQVGGLMADPHNSVRMDLVAALRLSWDANEAILSYDEDELQDAADAALLVAIGTWDGIAGKPKRNARS
jgi:hypothetical protein